MGIMPEILTMIEGIGSDSSHSASQLARLSMEVMRKAAESSMAADVSLFLAEQSEIGHRLADTRPAMAPLYNMVRRLRNFCVSSDSSPIFRFSSSVIFRFLF